MATHSLMAARIASSSLAGALHTEPLTGTPFRGRGLPLPQRTRRQQLCHEAAAITAILADRPKVEKNAEKVKELARELAERTKQMGKSTTSLESTNEHRAWVTAGSAALAALAAKGLVQVDSLEAGVGALAAMGAAYVLADFGTGVYHWSVDNYGDATTPVFGPQIDAFQGHHQRPWTITKRQFANNLHALCRPAFFFTVPFLALPSNAYADSFLAVFIACAVFSQQFHAWSHTKKSEMHPTVLALQEAGLLVSRREHGLHHRPPYHTNYCIVSGICNQPLDNFKFFAKLERFIFDKWGIAPRCWNETSEAWLEVAYDEDDAAVAQ